ncbi:hypothetical protein SEA_SALLYK_18 [Microbacterium phage SallyK]|nr:hypothetical protein SEA_SALLYK_18 [Microbacterium phage SallyK]
MGTRTEDDPRRPERMNSELRAHLDRARARREEREAAARRTRLHSFGLAGGRRA